MTVGEALQIAEQRLAAAGIDTPAVDSEWLVAHALGISRSDLSVDRDREVPGTFQVLLGRRAAREPLAYVLGEWGFRRLILKTDARALVPRPETETVVERALASIADLAEPLVLDLGTGTGAIALAIADEHPGARVTGVDSSAAALELARENAERLGLAVQIRAGGVEAVGAGWDLVVSNPPYVRPSEWDSLQSEIRGWEPREALVGVGWHEEIARRAKTRRLVLEVGDGQAQPVAEALAADGYEEVAITPDLSGRPRVVEGRRL